MKTYAVSTRNSKKEFTKWDVHNDWYSRLHVLLLVLYKIYKATRIMGIIIVTDDFSLSFFVPDILYWLYWFFFLLALLFFCWSVVNIDDEYWYYHCYYHHYTMFRLMCFFSSIPLFDCSAVVCSKNVSYFTEID